MWVNVFKVYNFAKIIYLQRDTFQLKSYQNFPIIWYQYTQTGTLYVQSTVCEPLHINCKLKPQIKIPQTLHTIVHIIFNM